MKGFAGKGVLMTDIHGSLTVVRCHAGDFIAELVEGGEGVTLLKARQIELEDGVSLESIARYGVYKPGTGQNACSLDQGGLGTITMGARAITERYPANMLVWRPWYQYHDWGNGDGTFTDPHGVRHSALYLD